MTTKILAQAYTNLHSHWDLNHNVSASPSQAVEPPRFQPQQITSNYTTRTPPVAPQTASNSNPDLDNQNPKLQLTNTTNNHPHGQHQHFAQSPNSKFQALKHHRRIFQLTNDTNSSRVNQTPDSESTNNFDSNTVAELKPRIPTRNTNQILKSQIGLTVEASPNIHQQPPWNSNSMKLKSGSSLDETTKARL
ncbi:hypothetical protein Droror1_Dr00009786 [Drosera rotundifolia]